MPHIEDVYVIFMLIKKSIFCLVKSAEFRIKINTQQKDVYLRKKAKTLIKLAQILFLSKFLKHLSLLYKMM